MWHSSGQAVTILQHANLIGISSIVLGELLAGFEVGTKTARNRHELSAFLNSPRVNIFPIDEDTAEHYAAVYKGLKRKGRPIPTNDLWIAATALQHGLALFTYDQHFLDVDGLRVGRQLADFLP